ncbi:hypothetical protein G7046_g9746 [Stylonectria norvegica]|nr:hypothetical protein G7046_g9746 [Stylonectria norvegica]
MSLTRTSQSFNRFLTALTATSILANARFAPCPPHPASQDVPLLRSTAMMGYNSRSGAPPGKAPVAQLQIPGLTMLHGQTDAALAPGQGTIRRSSAQAVPGSQRLLDFTTPSGLADVSQAIMPTPSAKHLPAKKGRQTKRIREPAPAVPSPASGGVPNPTRQYMTRALLDPSPLPTPRRILIIMDLNGTLLHRPNKRRPFHFVERPHAKDFLSYCLDTFYVAIWSSARPENVNRMVAQLLNPEQCERCLLVWARDQFGLSPTDYDSRVQVYKRLEKVWAHPRVMASHPAALEGGRWDQTNTILVDDSLEKARTEPFNLLQIPEFSGVAGEDSDVLPQVHDYLNRLAYQSDISRFTRQNPFTLDPNYKLDMAAS